LNFKSKFNLSTEQYRYLRKKYKVNKVVPRVARICWKCDRNLVSQLILNTNMCTSCYNEHVKSYYYNFIAIQKAPKVGVVIKALKDISYDQ
jgi:ribosomal protein L37AE/L43A